MLRRTDDQWEAAVFFTCGSNPVTGQLPPKALAQMVRMYHSPTKRDRSFILVKGDPSGSDNHFIYLRHEVWAAEVAQKISQF